jgi:hypothetical protein
MTGLEFGELFVSSWFPSVVTKLSSTVIRGDTRHGGVSSGGEILIGVTLSMTLVTGSEMGEYSHPILKWLCDFTIKL